MNKNQIAKVKIVAHEDLTENAKLCRYLKYHLSDVFLNLQVDDEVQRLIKKINLKKFDKMLFAVDDNPHLRYIDYIALNAKLISTNEKQLIQIKKLLKSEDN